MGIARVIIVSGKIYVKPGSRDQFLASSAAAMIQARESAACSDFVVAADPLESDRINVYEEWSSQEALSTFRGEGPGEDLSSLIVRAEVHQHEIG